eukprot:Clim_evm10s9 gene=Clim_evmTU10s9
MSLFSTFFVSPTVRALRHAGDAVREQMRMEGDVDGLAVIIGSGFGGLCAAIKFEQLGVPYVVLEKEDDLGGTWYKNTYPGCQCDIPTMLYSYSFELNPDWSDNYAYQPQILEYLRHCADKYNIRSHIKFHKEVTECNYDQENCLWSVNCKDGSEYRGKYLIRAMGGLDVPFFPDIAGKESFPGASFHSAHWDHSIDLKGKRVAVIGNGASAVQFVPRIANEVDQLYVYQRTNHWIMPRPDAKIPKFLNFACRWIPGLNFTLRTLVYWLQETLFTIVFTRDRFTAKGYANLLRWFMRKQLKHDQDMIKNLQPVFSPGCKRLLLTNEYYPTLMRDNVELLVDRIVAIEGNTLISEKGTRREADVMIYATGFKPFNVGSMITNGLNGKELGRDVMKDHPRSFLGVSFHDFPNCFTLLGPNTALGHNSVVIMIEAQMEHILEVIANAERAKVKEVNVKRETVDRWMKTIEIEFPGKVWATCGSWYLDEKGHNYTLYPKHTFEYMYDCQDTSITNFECR